jgi:CBS domain-containing protein
MRVSELMHTPAVTCAPTATLGEVARLMRDRNVGSVLVIDQIGYLTGIVTDRDLAIRGMGEGRSGDIDVEHVMSRDVVTTTLRADVSDAVAIMGKHGVRRLPVVDEDDRPHGIVTFDDVVRQLGTETDALVDMVKQQATKLTSP